MPTRTTEAGLILKLLDLAALNREIDVANPWMIMFKPTLPS